MIEVLKQALEAMQDLLDHTETPPDKNCSCHIAPPCSDCVDYSGIRYAIKQSRDTITSIDEAIREHAMYEVQRLGQEIEQEPVERDWRKAPWGFGEKRLSTVKYSDIVSDGGLDPRNKFDTPPQRTEQEPVAWRWQRLGQEWVLEGSLKQTPIDAVIVEPLYTHPPQLEQNFCPRCGKRTNDIHTCTPPMEKNNG